MYIQNCFPALTGAYICAASQSTGADGAHLHASSGAPGTSINLATIRAMVNESQRRGEFISFQRKYLALIRAIQGAHTPQGRVTAVSQQLSSASGSASSHPSIKTPSYFQHYFQAPPPSSQPQPSGYSSAHLRYEGERERWSNTAYKPPGQIPLRVQSKNEVRILLQVSYQVLSGKVEKTASTHLTL